MFNYVIKTLFVHVLFICVNKIKKKFAFFKVGQRKREKKHTKSVTVKRAKLIQHKRNLVIIFCRWSKSNCRRLYYFFSLSFFFFFSILCRHVLFTQKKYIFPIYAATFVKNRIIHKYNVVNFGKGMCSIEK